MEYRLLGRTGIRVSELCFGTMSFGAEADAKTSAEMFHRCREAGINFFDCADVYSQGRAEEILGNLLTGCRDEIVLTSKVNGAMSEDINARGLSRRHIMTAVENSLSRLKTDRIDIYFAHKFDSQAAIEHTLRAFDDLVSQGKILYPAVSNWAAWQIATALGISAKESLARFECMQPMYNLTKRQAETELLPLAEAEHLGVIPYSPLGGGLLTGKYNAGGNSNSGRLVERELYTKRYSLPHYFEIAQQFTKFAREHETHPATLAVAWVKSHPTVTAPIIGARNVNQLEPSLAAINFKMTKELRDQITALSIPPAPATDRLEEQLTNA